MTIRPENGETQHRNSLSLHWKKLAMKQLHKLLPHQLTIRIQPGSEKTKKLPDNVQLQMEHVGTLDSIRRAKKEKKRREYSQWALWKSTFWLGEQLTLTKSNGSPPKSIQPNPMVKRSYKNVITSRIQNMNSNNEQVGASLDGLALFKQSRNMLMNHSRYHRAPSYPKMQNCVECICKMQTKAGKTNLQITTNRLC